MISDPNRFEIHLQGNVAAMNCERLDELIRQISGNVNGWPGFWEFTVSGRWITCVADDTYDRMRFMTLVAALSDISSDQLTECLEANFDRTLDARYSISDGAVWSVFLHPLTSLTPGLVRSACRQILETADNFGKSYSSSEESFVNG